MDTFAQKFIALRDGGDSPQNSWKRREAFWRNGGVSLHAREYEDIAMSLAFSFEYLTHEDFEAVLLVGAHSNALRMTVYFQLSNSRDASCELLMRYYKSFILPLYHKTLLAAHRPHFPVMSRAVATCSFRSFPKVHCQKLNKNADLFLEMMHGNSWKKRGASKSALHYCGHTEGGASRPQRGRLFTY
jgi:hypothetical protein